MSDTLQFCGAITKITPDGRSAIVTLDQAVEGMGFAVISTETSGRVGLMNGKGSLSKDMRVAGTGVAGVDAIKALSVTEVHD
jgi:hypothetical protein